MSPVAESKTLFPGSVTHHMVIIVASPPVHNPPSIIHPPLVLTRVLLPCLNSSSVFCLWCSGITSFTNPTLFVSLIPPPVPIIIPCPHPSPHQPSCSIFSFSCPHLVWFPPTGLVSSQPLAQTLYRANNYTYHWKSCICHLVIYIFSVFGLTLEMTSKYIQLWTQLLEKGIELCVYTAIAMPINGKFQKDGRPLYII